MKNRLLYMALLLAMRAGNAKPLKIFLSKKILRTAPFSSRYSEDGSLIRSVDFRSVNDLIPQLEEKFQKFLKGQDLQDRNESHITIITPPEGKTDFFPGNIGINKVLANNKLIERYKRNLQSTVFNISCVGSDVHGVSKGVDTCIGDIVYN